MRVICAWLVLTASAVGGEYEFTNIAQEFTLGGPYYLSMSMPSISDDGTVFFAATKALNDQDNNPLNAIFAGDGDSIRTVIDSTGPFARFTEVAASKNGDVAFGAYLDDGTTGVYWTDGSTVKTIADSKMYPNLQFNSLDVNSSGQVSMIGVPLNLAPPAKIFRGDGGPLITIAQPGGNIAEVIGGQPSINASGDVGFVARMADEHYGVFVGDGTNTKTLYSQIDPPGVAYPTLVDDGSVAFLTSFGFSIVRGDGGPLETIADNSGDIHLIMGGPGLPNYVDSDKFAFLVLPKVGFGPTIVTGPDLVDDEVWGATDMLFGLKGGGVAMGNGLNNSGQIAFMASLGTRFGQKLYIVRADPVPEPSTWVLASLGLVALGMWKRLRR